MFKAFVSILFRYLKTDWFVRRQNFLDNTPFVLVSPDHGRMIITAANAIPQAQGIDEGMVVQDEGVITPSLTVLDDTPGISNKLLTGLAELCIRYTPAVAVDLPDGLI